MTSLKVTRDGTPNFQVTGNSLTSDSDHVDLGGLSSAVYGPTSTLGTEPCTLTCAALSLCQLAAPITAPRLPSAATDGKPGISSGRG